MALEVVDRAMQAYGAEGLSQDTELAVRWAQLRTLRIADVWKMFYIHEFDSQFLSGTRRRTYPASWTTRTQASTWFSQKGTRVEEERVCIDAKPRLEG